MKAERLLEIARIFAAAQALRDDAPEYLKGNPHTFMPHDWVLAALRGAADEAAITERERICAAIKAEDDHCAQADYMLDSNDCIAVARGTWVRPDYT